MREINEIDIDRVKKLYILGFSTQTIKKHMKYGSDGIVLSIEEIEEIIKDE